MIRYTGEMEDHKRRKGVRHRRRAESDKLLADYRSSGLTQKRWCEEHGIGIASLRYWLKREREEARGYSLVPVEVEGRFGGNGGLDLRVKGWVCVWAPGAICERWLHC